MSAPMSIEEAGGPREWLIRKGSYFYRHGWSGYTTVKSQAGRYTELEARREAENEPWHMVAIHQDMVSDPAGDINVSEITSLKDALAATQEENRRLLRRLESSEASSGLRLQRLIEANNELEDLRARAIGPTSQNDQPQTDEMQPDKYTTGDFNGVVRGKRP